ncbi:MAG: hypothetical protein M3R47_06755 [Chloroflexota bacterium]|nr:hypothetical protein [Chloroflexota bacterium]
MTTELCFLPAIDLARLLRNKELSAREVGLAHLKQIERVNPKVNAIVTLVAEQALAEADRVDSIRMRGELLGPGYAFEQACQIWKAIPK